jgi:energy-coupling factor transporter transmembrane protein EcfT
MRLISRAVALAAVVGIMIAMTFARLSSESYAVARLQPLRIFQFIYLVMLAMLGGLFGAKLLQHKLWRWACFFVLSGGSMLFVQMQTYPHSAHLEVPWKASANNWQQAFLWIREHTPKNALFALDAQYIASPGEDSQNFRAIAERSVLPDYSKDGGLAAIAPELAIQWSYGESLQRHLDRVSDFSRVERLAPLAVTWIVLSSNAQTALTCPYQNQSVKVCRMSGSMDIAEVSRR